MNVKKFRAANTRDALRQVRDALGADAIILSNRPVDGMIEIMAVANMDVASIATPALASAPVISQPRKPQPQEPRLSPASHEPRPVKPEEISVLQRWRLIRRPRVNCRRRPANSCRRFTASLAMRHLQHFRR